MQVKGCTLKAITNVATDRMDKGLMDKKTEMSIRISQKSALMSRVDKTNGQVPSCCVKLLSICPSCPFGLMMDKSVCPSGIRMDKMDKMDKIITI